MYNNTGTNNNGLHYFSSFDLDAGMEAYWEESRRVKALSEKLDADKRAYREARERSSGKHLFHPDNHVSSFPSFPGVAYRTMPPAGRETKTHQIKTKKRKGITSEKSKRQSETEQGVHKKQRLETANHRIGTENQHLYPENSNFVKEKDNPYTEYQLLVSKRDKLLAAFNEIASANQDLETSKNQIASERDELLVEAAEMKSARDKLQAENQLYASERLILHAAFRSAFNQVTNEKNNLKASHDLMAREKQQLYKENRQMATEIQQLQTKIDEEAIGKQFLRAEKHCVKAAFARAKNENRILCTENEQLVGEWDKLQTRYQRALDELNELKRSSGEYLIEVQEHQNTIKETLEEIANNGRSSEEDLLSSVIYELGLDRKDGQPE